MLITEWKSLISYLSDSTLTVAERAAGFHRALAHAMLQQATAIRERTAVTRVSLSGGVFQNRVLAEQAMAMLAAAGFEVVLPELIPVNDAGISFGQVMEYGYRNLTP
jgi:hydrogenase maturation protein HypF